MKISRYNVPIVGLPSLSALASRSSLLAKASPMSPSAVLSADELGNNRAVVHMMTIAQVISGKSRCIRPSVPLVTKAPSCHSSITKVDRCTVVTATEKSDLVDKLI